MNNDLKKVKAYLEKTNEATGTVFDEMYPLNLEDIKAFKFDINTVVFFGKNNIMLRCGDDSNVVYMSDWQAEEGGMFSKYLRRRPENLYVLTLPDNNGQLLLAKDSIDITDLFEHKKFVTMEINGYRYFLLLFSRATFNNIVPFEAEAKQSFPVVEEPEEEPVDDRPKCFSLF